MANTTVYPYGTNGELPSSIGLVNDFATGGADKALTAEAGKNFYEEVFGSVEQQTYTKASATPYYVDTRGNEVSSNPMRIRVVIPVLVGDIVTASCSLGKGVAASVYNTVVNAKKAEPNYLQTLSYSYVSSVEGEITANGYLTVSLCKSDSSAFTSQEIEDFMNALNMSVVRTPQRTGVFYDEVFGEMQYEEYTKADATAYKVNNGNIVTSNFTRIRVVIELKDGDTMSASCSLGKGVAASVYANLGDALAAGPNYLQTISYTYEASLTGTLEIDGFLTVSLSKSDDSVFSDAEYTQYLNALTLTGLRKARGVGAIALIQEEINELRGEIADIDSNKVQEVFIGTLVQKKMTSSGLSDDDYRVSMASCIVVPRENAKLTFTLPEEYEVGIRSGNEADNLSNNNYWYTNGQSFTFANGVHYYRLCFAKLPDPATTQITVSEINSHIEDGLIRITISYEDDIIQRNMENEKYVKAIMRNFVSGASNNGSLTKLPVFAHTSDVHGDANRFMSYMDYCDYLKLDAMLVTGDTVASTPANSMQYINDIADEHTTPVLICTGNHDCVGLSTKQSQNEQIMGYLITKNGSTTAQGETYPTYYYQDFSSKSIRVISLNLYETNHTSHSCNFSQDQCEWLIDVLASTPANYGVMILFHAPEGRPVKDNNYATFYQDLLNWSTYYQDALTGNVFRKIIDAFIGKTTASITYTSKSTSITVSADFTGVASGVEFIAYLSGHMHADLVGYTEGSTYKQLNLNVPCGVAIYGSTYYYLANNSEVPRGCSGSTQDCFNIYAIDRTAKTVRIARVGSNITGRLTERKYMEIPYAD